jgi:hypothetical protein
MLRASVAESLGDQVTTYCRLGGVGLGRLVDGKVYESGGNGFYYEAGSADEPFGLVRYEVDDGEGYLAAVRAVGTRR